MAARVNEDDLPQMAKAAGKSGKPLPPWASAEPRLRAAYFDGAGTPDPEATPQTPKTQPHRDPTNKAGGSRSSASAARPSGATARKAGAATKRKKTINSRTADLIAHPATLGTGSGGGLLLAVFAYPLVLSILQYGKQGPNRWFNAKFLNKTLSITESNPYANQPAAPSTNNRPRGTGTEIQ